MADRPQPDHTRPDDGSRRRTGRSASAIGLGLLPGTPRVGSDLPARGNLVATQPEAPPPTACSECHCRPFLDQLSDALDTALDEGPPIALDIVADALEMVARQRETAA